MNIIKEDIWRYEKPLTILSKRISCNGYFYLPRRFLKENDLNENFVALFRIASNKSLFCLSKISKVREDYILKINSKILKKLKIKLPSLIELEFLQFKEMGFKPKLKIIDKNVNLFEYIPKNNKFTCFERHGNWVTIYYLNGRSSSYLTIKNPIKINKLFLWNIGFYLAEGLKSTDYRFGVSNAEINLIKLFKDYGEKCLGLDKFDWYTDLRLKHWDEKIVKYWISNLDLDKKKIKVRIVKNKPPESKFGNLSLVFNSIILGTINKNLIYDINFIRTLDKKQKLFIIRGLEAGDGTVMRRSNAFEFGITCQQREMEIAKYLLSSVCSKAPYIRKYYTCDKVWFVFHRGIEMGREYIMDEHFLEHIKRRDRLITLYKSYKTREILCLYLLLNGKDTVRKLSREMGLTYSAINLRLKGLIRHGFLIIRHEKLFRNNRVYDNRRFYLTDEGKRYVNYFY